MPHSRVWWVSALRSTLRTGSSSWRRWRALASLSSSALLFGLDGRGQHRGRRLERLDGDVGPPLGEDVAGRRVVQLGHGGDVAGRHLRGRLLLPAPQGQQLVEALVGHGPAVGQHGVGLHLARHHLEHVDPADVGVGDRLEHEGGRRPVGRGRGGGRLVGEEPAQPVDPDQLGGAAAQHREDRAGGDALGQRPGQLLVVDRLVGQVPLHEVVVGHDDALDQGVVDGVLLLGQPVRHLALRHTGRRCRCRPCRSAGRRRRRGRPPRRWAAGWGRRRRRSGSSGRRRCGRSWPGPGRAC